MILIADNIHALNPIVSEAMQRYDPLPLQQLALRCQEAGAGFIDINPGYLTRRREDTVVFMVEAVQEVTALPLVLDSPNPRVLEKGLQACRGKPILNALSLEERKLQEILPLAAEYRTRLVLLLMDEKSFTPPTMEEKIAIALELREHAMAAGLGHEDLIFDPVLPNLSWQDAFMRIAEVVKTVRVLESGTIFQESAKTMVGLSNIRSGLRKVYPSQIELTSFCMLAGAGLHYVLANALDQNLLETLVTVNRLS